AALAPSAASASTAPRERLKTWTVWPAASSRCVIGRPILPRPMKPTCIALKGTGRRDLAWCGDRRQAAAGLIDLAGQRMPNCSHDEARSFQHSLEVHPVGD